MTFEHLWSENIYKLIPGYISTSNAVGDEARDSASILSAMQQFYFLETQSFEQISTNPDARDSSHGLPIQL